MFRSRLGFVLKRTILGKPLRYPSRCYVCSQVVPYRYVKRFSTGSETSIIESQEPEGENLHLLNDEEKSNVSLTSDKSISSVDTVGPLEESVKRALTNKPDDEWDVTVEYTTSFPNSNISEDLSELQEDLDNSGSSTAANNDMFYNWQWKIIGTSRLLETALGGWTDDQWFSAENILLNGWSEQRCIRAVILQFALLQRACQEMEMSKLDILPAVQTSSESITPTNHAYNQSFDSAVSLSNGESTMEADHNSALLKGKFGKKLLSKLFSNWQCVYMYFPDVLRQNQLSPQEMLDNTVNIYSKRYQIPVSEKVFRHILLAEIHYRDNCTPEFAETVLSHTLDLYDSGMDDCLPTTPLWNYVLLSWVMANRRKASSDGVARIVRLMDELKVKRSRQTYRILFRECLQRGTEQSARDAESLLRQMYKDFLADNSCVQPDMSSFIYVADAWAKSKSILAGPRAEQIYEQMKALRAKNHLFETGIAFDDLNRETRLVTCVLMCWVAVGNPSAAEKAETFLRYSGVVPDSSTFAALINIYAKNNNVEGAERLWNEMASSKDIDGEQVKEIEFSASALLNAYSTSKIPNKVEKAEALLNRMKSSANANIDTACYNGTLFQWRLN
jgi:pentatricopeptide repeat protein